MSNRSKQCFHIKAVGDIMLGDHPVCIGHGVRSLADHYGMDYVFERITSSLQGGDVVFGNLESILSNTGYKEKSLVSCELRGRPQFSEVLAKKGFNVLSIANNHIMQHGIGAFEDTINQLKIHNIKYVGKLLDGSSNVVEFTKSKLNIAFIGYSMRREKYYGKSLPYANVVSENYIEQIRNLKDKGKTVVVSLHWGEEYVNYPSRQQIEIAHKIIDHGASLILGHHPHVLQGIEKYRNGVIVYSLGNFIFDKWQRNPRETMLLDCFINQDGFVEYEITPIFINKKYQPCVASEANSKIILNKLKRYTEYIYKIEKDNRLCKDYDKKAKYAYLRFRIESYMYFVRNIYRYKAWMIVQSLVRFIQRRVN